MKEAISFIKNLNISTDEPVIVACSGGPDSMYLLYVLKNLGLKVVCAHVNHNVRKESVDEFKFMEDYCKDHDIIFEGTEIIDAPVKDFENFARMFRYNFFEELIKKYNAKYLFTAHHGDDLIETILMRIARGSTLNGYAGFNFITEKPTYKIIRPLIYMTKEEIENENKKNNIPYKIDNTNFEDEHTRNRYRHHILPFLKNENSNIHEQFIKYHNILQGYYDYVNKLVYEEISKIYVDNTLDINMFNKLDDFLKEKVLQEIIRPWYPDNLYYVGSNNIDEIFKVIKSSKPNIELDLPRDVKVIKEYNKLIFTSDSNSFEEYNKEIKEETIIPTGKLVIVPSSNDKSNYTIRLPKDTYYVRNKHESDTIKIKNMKGTKKVKDILINEKVPKKLRNSYPVVLNSKNEIVWIPGLKKSDFDMAIDSNYDIIIKYEKEKKNEQEK